MKTTWENNKSETILEANVKYLINCEITQFISNGVLGNFFDSIFQFQGKLEEEDWDFQHLPEEGVSGSFQIYARPEYYFAEPDTDIFSIDEFFDTMSSLLISYGVTYPNEKSISDQLLERLPTYRAKFKM